MEKVKLPIKNDLLIHTQVLGVITQLKKPTSYVSYIMINNNIMSSLRTKKGGTITIIVAGKEDSNCMNNNIRLQVEITEDACLSFLENLDSTESPNPIHGVKLHILKGRSVFFPPKSNLPEND